MPDDLTLSPEVQEKVRALLRTHAFRGRTFEAFVKRAMCGLAPCFHELYHPDKPTAVWNYDERFEQVECASCGDSYERHFDSGDIDAPPVGCKNCECREFVFPNHVDPRRSQGADND